MHIISLMMELLTCVCMHTHVTYDCITMSMFMSLVINKEMYFFLKIHLGINGKMPKDYKELIHEN